MFKWLSIRNYIRRIKGIRNDIKAKRIFLKYLPSLYTDRFLQKYRKKLLEDRMFLGIDLLPEIKLQKQDDLALENEEKRRLAIEISKFNDVFARHGLLEFVKIIPVKVDTDNHYGFMIEVVYKYSSITAKIISYVIFYSLFLLGIIGIVAYLLLTNFLIA